MSIRPDLVQVALQVEQGRAPVDRRTLRLRGVGAGSQSSVELVTDRLGRADLDLFPGEPYVVSVAQAQGPDWVYGKVVPGDRPHFVESIPRAADVRR